MTMLLLGSKARSTGRIRSWIHRVLTMTTKRDMEWRSRWH